MEYRLTYGMLLEQLKTLSPEQLKLDVTIFNMHDDEVFQIVDFDIVGEEEDQDVRPEEDVLEASHPYLVF